MKMMQDMGGTMDKLILLDERYVDMWPLGRPLAANASIGKVTASSAAAAASASSSRHRNESFLMFSVFGDEAYGQRHENYTIAKANYALRHGYHFTHDAAASYGKQR